VEERAEGIDAMVSSRTAARDVVHPIKHKIYIYRFGIMVAVGCRRCGDGYKFGSRRCSYMHFVTVNGPCMA